MISYANSAVILVLKIVKICKAEGLLITCDLLQMISKSSLLLENLELYNGRSCVNGTIQAEGTRQPQKRQVWKYGWELMLGGCDPMRASRFVL